MHASQNASVCVQHASQYVCKCVCTTRIRSSVGCKKHHLSMSTALNIYQSECALFGQLSHYPEHPVSLLLCLLQFINHSCEPSAFFDCKKLELIALRDLAVGDQVCWCSALTFNLCVGVSPWHHEPVGQRQGAYLDCSQDPNIKYMPC